MPVDVSGIAEFDLDMEIQPVASMREQTDVDAVRLGDMKTIAGDSGLCMDDRMQNRMRYSVAREIGHKELHADVSRVAGASGVEDWIRWLQSIPDDPHP